MVAVIKETGISYTAAYGKIKSLVDDGLVIAEKINITDDGKNSATP